LSTAFVDSVHRAQRSIDGARALFREGLPAECHVFMGRALHLFLEGWASVGSLESENADPGHTRERGLAALERAGYRRTARLRAALILAERSWTDTLAAAPLRDAEWVWAEVEQLARRSARQALSERARKLGRLRIALLSGLALLVVLAISSRLWGRPHARASSIYSVPHAAANAIDGLEATEWLLPDATPGWVDVMFHSARAVHGVTLVNAHNVFYLDRAAQAVRVTAFTERGEAASVEGSFARLSQDRSTIELPLKAEGVTRVRVDVLTYFKLGGGLAEIEVH
jgi:hypothetical protein